MQNQKLKTLRKKYPRFVYESSNYKVINGDLKIVFNFKIESGVKFKPEIAIKNIDKKRLTQIGDRALENFIFHLGLMEIPSYWKATCSPIIEIKAGFLNSEQIKWWKDLIIKGMGQYFYENKIDWRKPDFLRIICRNAEKNERLVHYKLKNRILVPIGGGKDSIVTLEQLKLDRERVSNQTAEKTMREINCFLLNPSAFSKNVVKTAEIKNPIIVERKIDPFLLRLNKKGYLNGHTPFTALLSFLSVFCSVLFDYKNIAFSNERSANEGNVKYLGKMINHQWSKSSEFEKKFKWYCKKYLAKNINYFSYLRKYTELEISKMFTKYPQYFSVFSSCNAGRKTGERWCGNCPKCLFVYAALYPYLGQKQLLKIFGKDIFKNKALLPIMKSLIGQGKEKPFECVGTFRENRLAFRLSLEKAKKTGKIPYLLTKFSE